MNGKNDNVRYSVPAVIPAEEAAGMYVEAGWMTEPDAEEVAAMLKGTFAVSAAFEDGRLIGFMRAISDGVSDAYLLDLVVRKECRRRGIGKKICENLEDYLNAKGIEWSVFVGAPGTEAFYRSSDKHQIMKGYTPYRVNAPEQ